MAAGGPQELTALRAESPTAPRLGFAGRWSVKRTRDTGNDQVAVPAARTGRPRRSLEPLNRGDLVRVEVRLPAVVAAALFARARSQGIPMSRTAALLLAAALGEETPLGS